MRIPRYTVIHDNACRCVGNLARPCGRNDIIAILLTECKHFFYFFNSVIRSEKATGLSRIFPLLHSLINILSPIDVHHFFAVSVIITVMEYFAFSMLIFIIFMYKAPAYLQYFRSVFLCPHAQKKDLGKTHDDAIDPFFHHHSSKYEKTCSLFHIR